MHMKMRLAHMYVCVCSLFCFRVAIICHLATHLNQPEAVLSSCQPTTIVLNINPPIPLHPSVHARLAISMHTPSSVSPVLPLLNTCFLSIFQSMTTESDLLVKPEI